MIEYRVELDFINSDGNSNNHFNQGYKKNYPLINLVKKNI
jgi:hypothetical protein